MNNNHNNNNNNNNNNNDNNNNNNNNEIFLPFQNGGQMTDFRFASDRFRRTFEKTLSKGNFQ